jgi:hypothetical protein
LRHDLKTVSAVAMSMTADRQAMLSSRDVADGAGEFEAYRTVSAAAVVACVLGIVSITALADYWALKAIPVMGLVAGLVASRQIAKYPDELSGRKAALIGVALSAVFLTFGSGLSWWTYVAELPDGYERIGYEMLKPVAAAPNAPPPEAVALDGRRVFIKGYMYPTDQTEGVRRFVLCRDNGDCCFGGQPPKSDMVFVELVDPLDTKFTSQVRKVAGTFRVAGMRSSEVKQDVFYRLEADYIQ